MDAEMLCEETHGFAADLERFEQTIFLREDLASTPTRHALHDTTSFETRAACSRTS
jgi:hypothetical protein